MGREIVTKKDLDETKKELKGEINKIRNDIYKNIATKEDIEKLFNKLKTAKVASKCIAYSYIAIYM